MFPQAGATRTIRLSAAQMSAVKGWGFMFNIIGGAYIGGLIVCFGSLYFLYEDANERQPIPYELSFANQLTAVKAINKDDVLKSPRHALKHYRRLLIEINKEEGSVDFDEDAPENKYRAPILNSDVLVDKKSNNYANFYVDIVSRYAKALLAKGQLDLSTETLRKLVDDDRVFHEFGDAERLSQCCRLLAKISPTLDEKESLYTRSITMLRSTFSSIRLTEDLLFEPNSRITDELVACLNGLAFSYGKEAMNDKKNKDKYLTKALHIYLSNLKKLQTIQGEINTRAKTQSSYPLFNCTETNLQMLINDIRTHVSEIMWAKGYKKNAVSWGEEVVDDIYHQHATSKRANEILTNDLGNLIVMYQKLRNTNGQQRCEKLKNDIRSFDIDDGDWYAALVNRISKIIYHKGPLGVVEKGLLERFGPPTKIPELEEIEPEDEE